MIPAAIDDDSTGVSGGWYRAPGWRASEHASEGAARRKRLLPAAIDDDSTGSISLFDRMIERSAKRDHAPELFGVTEPGAGLGGQPWPRYLAAELAARALVLLSSL
jgi:hypothetical protein